LLGCAGRGCGAQGLRDQSEGLVVAHIVELMLTGKLRAGDRIDHKELAKSLGISRMPIQEAMVELEGAGIVSSQYHRGVFVERFDEFTVREYYEIYGLLSALATVRAAADPARPIVEQLESVIEVMRSNTDVGSFRDAAREYRLAIYAEYPGPRLYALIRASPIFTPSSAWAAYDRARDHLLPLFEVGVLPESN
jgi:DNA-binding GntR family transcriptional regulator